MSPHRPIEDKQAFWCGISMTGTDAWISLPARLTSSIFLKLGIVVPSEELVCSFLENLEFCRSPASPSLTKYLPGHKAVFLPTEDGIKLSMVINQDWKIELCSSGFQESSIIRCFAFCDNEWELQDLPYGHPAETTISLSNNFGDCRQSGLVYVARERHFFQGKRWDPSPHRPADIACYDHGGLRWWMGYRSDTPFSYPNSPWCELYWPEGSVMVREFCDPGGSWHSHSPHNPVYSEYFQWGLPSLELFVDPESSTPREKWYNGKGSEMKCPSILKNPPLPPRARGNPFDLMEDIFHRQQECQLENTPRLSS